MRKVVIGLLLTAALGGAASAQTAAFKCPPPGTTVEYSNGAVATWQSQQGNACVIKQKLPNGTETVVNWYAPTATVRIGTSLTWAEQVKPSALWPLQAGKKLSARYDGPGNDPGFSGSWTFDIRVEKYETVTTKAGTFPAFVILNESDQIGRRFKTMNRSWYAPGPGVVVKFETSSNNGLQTSNAEAIAIRQ